MLTTPCNGIACCVSTITRSGFSTCKFSINEASRSFVKSRACKKVCFPILKVGIQPQSIYLPSAINPHAPVLAPTSIPIRIFMQPRLSLFGCKISAVLSTDHTQHDATQQHTTRVSLCHEIKAAKCAVLTLPHSDLQVMFTVRSR